MARTTVDIDAPILREVKRLQQREGQSLGRVISDLLAEALHHRREASEAPAFDWASQSMHARVDLEDKDAVYAILDGTTGVGRAADS